MCGRARKGHGARRPAYHFLRPCLARSRLGRDGMKGLRRSGSGSGASAPPDVADSPPVPASLVRGAARGEQLGGPAVRRRRRRRRILIAAPFLVLLSWAVVSYTAWMLQPTSLRWDVRSVEWVRQQVPFGNWLVDEREHIYYSWN